MESLRDRFLVALINSAFRTPSSAFGSGSCVLGITRNPHYAGLDPGCMQAL